MTIIKIAKGPDKGGLFIRVSNYEAHQLIWSLSEQLTRGNPNSGRHETRDDKDHYFSISVAEPKEDEEE